MFLISFEVVTCQMIVSVLVETVLIVVAEATLQAANMTKIVLLPYVV